MAADLDMARPGVGAFQRRGPALRAWAARWERLARTIFSDWPARWRQRLDLSELTDDGLRDIGISRPAMERERRKYFWQ